MMYVTWFVLILAAGLLGRKRRFGFWGFFVSALALSLALSFVGLGPLGPIAVIIVWAVTAPKPKPSNSG